MRKVNFGAGPAALDLNVLKRYSQDLIDFEGSGVGVGELSHRGKAFESQILAKASESILEISGFRADHWQVLWMTGGGTGQFSAVPINLGGGAVYLITGAWSEKAAEEAVKMIGASEVISVDLRCTDSKGIKSLREPSDWLNELKTKLSNNGDFKLCYFYYCDNETVDGLEIPEPNYFQDLLEGQVEEAAVFVVDASSNFLSRPLPDADGRTSLIFAGVQKNLGAAGVTAVLIKRQLLQQTNPIRCPAVLDFKLTAKHNSLLNTPPVLAIHMCNLVLQDLRSRFPAGLPAVDQFSREKSGRIYAAVEASPRGLWCPVAPAFRSRMNVVFRAAGGEAEEDRFIREAEDEGMIQLKGHRSVGGMRASLYNAITLDNVDQLHNLIMKP